MIDGYDIGAIAFAAPHLVHDWHLQPSDLKWVLTASNIGVLFGSQLMGFVGDRYGRKTALIVSNLLFGVLTFAAAYSTDLTQMFWLRFFAGFGIGGVIPNIVAINAKFRAAPFARDHRHHRRRLCPGGGALAGFASAALIPRYGWPVLFHIGGVIPVVAALGGIIGLPELIKYMALHEGGRAKMAKSGRRDPPRLRRAGERAFCHRGRATGALLQSGLFVPQRFVADHAAALAPLRAQPDGLFLAYQLDTDLARSRQAAAGDGGARRRRAADRRHHRRAGAVLVAATAPLLRDCDLVVLAVPVVASIGYAGLTSATALLAATFFGGFLVLGIQSGINVSGALVYPTSLRANGSGWELGIGRLGSIIGPLLGALFVGLSVEKLYIWSALPFAAGAIVCFAIHTLNTARLDAHPELKQAQ